MIERPLSTQSGVGRGAHATTFPPFRPAAYGPWWPLWSHRERRTLGGGKRCPRGRGPGVARGHLAVWGRRRSPRLRIQIVNRLQRLLGKLIPGQREKDLSAPEPRRAPTVRFCDIAGKTRRRMAAEEFTDLVAVDAKLKKMQPELRSAVQGRVSTLMEYAVTSTHAPADAVEATFTKALQVDVHTTIPHNSSGGTRIPRSRAQEAHCLKSLSPVNRSPMSGTPVAVRFTNRGRHGRRSPRAVKDDVHATANWGHMSRPGCRSRW